MICYFTLSSMQKLVPKQKFNIGLIAKELTEKLIRRHPHIYKDVKVKNTDQVVTNWEK